jgi:hypothetical protein
MRFRTHLLTSVVAGLALYPRRPLRLATLVLAGTLVDLDHLLLYGLQTGDWSVVGALRYDRYRHRGAGRGDTRPRYGSLRSWLHEGWLVLPPLWLGALAHAPLRPAALGLSLHLLLDHYDWPWRYAARRQAGGLCHGCGRRARLLVHRFGRRGARSYRALCGACGERVAMQGEWATAPHAEARRMPAGAVVH